MTRSIKKVWNMLNLIQRKKMYLLMILTIISMFLEILGVGLAVPAITLLVRTDIVTEYPILKPIINLLGNPSHMEIVIFGMISLVLIYLIKNIYIAYFIWYQNKFACIFQVSISQKLFEKYLNQDYAFHLRRNSAQLIRNVQEIVTGVQGAVAVILVLLTELLVFFGIVILLLYVEPLGALVVGSITTIVAIFFNLKTKKFFQIWGEKQNYYAGQSKQHLMQGLGGVKEVKILGREKFFFSLYYFYQSAAQNIQVLFNFVNSLPRLLFEVMTLTGLVSLVITMMSQNRTIEEIIPTLGLFAMAAFRLMPSTNRIIISVQSLWYCKDSINIIDKELNLLNSYKDTRKYNLDEKYFSIPEKSVISLKSIFFTYAGTEKPVLSNISLDINQGETIGFIGPSGAGKTTLVDLILGLLIQDSGEITLNGKNIHENIRSWQNQIGYVPQSIYLIDDTLRKNIALGLEEDAIDDSLIKKAIISSKLEEMVENLPEGLNTFVGERGIRLSGGQKQRIGIARALYNNPEILVLDEATSSLDNETESGIVDALKKIKGEKTVLIIAHRQSTVAHCDKLIKIVEGKIQNEK